jgi:hypothetical protein
MDTKHNRKPRRWLLIVGLLLLVAGLGLADWEQIHSMTAQEFSHGFVLSGPISGPPTLLILGGGVISVLALMRGAPRS